MQPAYSAVTTHRRFDGKGGKLFPCAANRQDLNMPGTKRAVENFEVCYRVSSKYPTLTSDRMSCETPWWTGIFVLRFSCVAGSTTIGTMTLHSSFSGHNMPHRCCPVVSQDCGKLLDGCEWKTNCNVAQQFINNNWMHSSGEFDTEWDFSTARVCCVQ